MTGDAAQPSVNGLDGRSLDEQTLALAFGSRERLNLLRVGVALYAFTREGSGVVETGQRRRGLRVFSQRLNSRLKDQSQADARHGQTETNGNDDPMRPFPGEHSALTPMGQPGGR
ncbi:MAG: hypothetical protein PVH80_08760 [Anaerolineae bacterium]